MSDQRVELFPSASPWWRAGLGATAIGWAAQQFTPLLLLYQSRLGLATTTIQGTFGIYVLGLIPGLLLGGPVSDRFGRRRMMVLALLFSIVSTVLSILGGGGVGWLFAGRLLAGVSSGAGFSSGAAWVKELSAAEAPDGARHAPRRLTIAMGVGFSLGPLVAGALAQWAPAPTVLPYVPHMVLATVALLLALGTTETRVESDHGNLVEHLRIEEVRERRFLSVVVPMAPWVFIAVSVAVAYLPGLVKSQLATQAVIFSAIVVVLNAGAGIFVQPLARRVDQPGTARLLGMALAIVVGGLLVGALAVAMSQPALVLVATFVLGAGYGSCQVCGLTEVQRLARPQHLAGLTAIYQAVGYVGFAASYPLAWATGAVSPPVLLLGVAALAAITLVWTTREAAVTKPRSAAVAAGE